MHTLLRLPLIAVAMAAFAACGRGPAHAEPAAEALAPAASDFSVYDLESQWRDQDGTQRTLGSLRGRVQVVAMVYTSCTHTCPLIVAEMKRLDSALGAEERSRVGFLLVSLDPDRDGPAELKRFAAAMRLDPARWTLLTGGAGDARELAALLGIRYRAEMDAQISHSNTYLVLDPTGRPAHRQDGIGGGTATPLQRVRAAVR